jgi:pyruvate-formate lyase-activating enzyme
MRSNFKSSRKIEIIKRQGNKNKIYRKKIKKLSTTIKYKKCPARCPYCNERFSSMREWGLHIKEEHCR